MNTNKTIMHIDMDAFFAPIEQQVNPALRGKPVIIGGRNNKYRSIICAASYEAKALGVDNAMPSWKALKICPQAIFVPADSSKYIYTSNQIHEMLKQYSPQVEKFSIDEFFLDVGGCEKFFGSLEKMGRTIKEEIKGRFGITCSIGIAPTRITAKLAAKMHKPDGFSIMSKQEISDKLKTMPVDKICGIGSRLKRRFNSLGVKTCGELAQYPSYLLKKHFGVVGLWLKAACLVEDGADIGYYADRPLPPKSVGHSQTLREATDDQELIKSWMYLLCEMVAERLRRKQLQGRTVHFYFSDGFGGGWAKQRTFENPTIDGQEIYHRCLKILESFHLSYVCARVLAVSVSGLILADHVYLFEQEKKRGRLMSNVDQINQRFGKWTVFPAALQKAKY